jgi:hypothetical protein
MNVCPTTVSPAVKLRHRTFSQPRVRRRRVARGPIAARQGRADPRSGEPRFQPLVDAFHNEIPSFFRPGMPPRWGDGTASGIAAVLTRLSGIRSRIDRSHLLARSGSPPRPSYRDHHRCVLAAHPSERRGLLSDDIEASTSDVSKMPLIRIARFVD